MKTHAFAKALKSLVDILERSPNTEISKLNVVLGSVKEIDSGEVALNLKTLHSLSKIKKNEWQALIQDYGFEINIEHRDSSRNIIGKLLNYLDNNPKALDTLKRKAKGTTEGPSALSRALDILLKDL